MDEIIAISILHPASTMTMFAFIFCCQYVGYGFGSCISMPDDYESNFNSQRPEARRCHEEAWPV